MPSARPVLATVCALAATAALAACGSSSDTKTVTVDQTGSASSSGGSASPTANDIDQALVSVVQKLSPQVVQIETSSGLGSGVVYDDRGDIVTNAHVVGGAKTVTVTLAHGDRHHADVVGTFAADDLAVVRLDPVPSPAPKPATWADSAKLHVGQLVLALGNPLGLRSSVTNGIISSLGRTVPEGNGAVITSAIQTSAPINPGNSGGALVDLDSAVVGIPTLAAIDPDLGGSQADGIGFAIPSNTVKRIAAQLIADGHVTASGRAFLGIDVGTGIMADGAVVASVQKNGPADDAGLRAGDIITSVAGHAVHSADDLTTVLAGLKPGQTVKVVVRSADGGASRTASVKLGQLPGDA
jgi:S1-C subfamily serine protease